MAPAMQGRNRAKALLAEDGFPNWGPADRIRLPSSGSTGDQHAALCDRPRRHVTVSLGRRAGCSLVFKTHPSPVTLSTIGWVAICTGHLASPSVTFWQRSGAG